MKKAPFLRRCGATQLNTVWSWCATMSDGTLLILCWQKDWNKGRPRVFDPKLDWFDRPDSLGGQELRERLHALGDGARVLVAFCIEKEKAKPSESRIEDIVERLWPAKLVFEPDGRIFAELDEIPR
jgi:hypothetical protein